MICLAFVCYLNGIFGYNTIRIPSQILILSADPVTNDVGLPTFRVEECPQHEAPTPDLCVDVLFADGSHDVLLMFSPYEDAPTVMKGILGSNPETKVVVILKDEDNPEATVSTNPGTKI